MAVHDRALMAYLAARMRNPGPCGGHCFAESCGKPCAAQDGHEGPCLCKECEEFGAEWMRGEHP